MVDRPSQASGSARCTEQDRPYTIKCILSYFTRTTRSYSCIYPLVLSSKKNSFFGVENEIR